MALLQGPKVLKYWQVVEHLREKIAKGDLAPGSRVPSLAEMQASFGVSRITVEKAYTLLEQDGLLVREQGRGTFVAPPPAAKSSSPRSSFSSGIIGLLVLTANPYHPYMLHLLSGIRSEANKLGIETLWLDKGESIPWQKLDGVLMYLGNSEPAMLDFPADMPRVSILRQRDGIANVTADEFGSAELATQHLLDLGHRRISCLFPPPDDYFSRSRLAGYHSALRKASVEADSSWVNYIHFASPGGYIISGEACMRRWLEQDWLALGCTAVLATNDEVAIGIIKALAAKGLRVPEDVSVVGFDGIEVSEYSTPRLTTIEIPLHDIGACGMRLLWEQKNGVTQPQDRMLPTRLKIGDSSAPPARSSEVSPVK